MIAKTRRQPHAWLASRACVRRNDHPSAAHGRTRLMMANIRWLPPLVADAGAWLSRAFDFSDLAGGSTVWLAVTGLSRSGKTVLITSLVHNLLSALHNPSRMALLKVVGEGRLAAARIEGAKAHRLPRFPYRGNI